MTSSAGQSGWQVGTLSAPIAIAAGQTYVASYGYVFNNGQGAVESYAATGGFFDSSRPGPDGVLTGLAGPGNGVFAAGAPGSFPTSSFNNSNYWADVAFAAIS